MSILNKLILFLSLISSLSVYGGPVHPDISKLRIYRTYYHMKLESPTAEQFEVWYQFKGDKNFLEWRVFQLALQKVGESQHISKSKYLPTNRFYAGYPSPPRDFTPVPADLKEFENGIIASVIENHSDLSIQQVQVHYLGKYARIYAHELIPISQDSDFSKRFIIRGNWFYFADLITGKIKVPGNGYTSISSLGFASEDLGESPKWVDVELPLSIEGSSLLFLDGLLPDDLNEKPLPKLYSECKDKVLSKILSMARELEANPQTSFPLENILSRQSSSLLPENLQQHIRFRIPFYGRAADFNNQLSGQMTFLIPTQIGAFHLEKTDKSSQLRFIIDGSMTEEKMTLRLTVSDVQGHSVEKVFVSEGAKNYGLVRDGQTTIINGVIYLKSENSRISLPGHGDYTSFDVYPDEAIYPTLLTGLKAE